MKPYCVLGARALSAFLWKRPSLDGLARYDFNLMRLSPRSGRSVHLFRHGDIATLLKLIALLADVLQDDGCMTASERNRLAFVAVELGRMIDRLA